MARTIIQNALILTMHPGAEVIPAASLILQDGVVEGFSEDAQAVDAGAEIINARGALVFPGLVNAHTHNYSALVRGLQVPVDSSSFSKLLETLWWRLDAVLEPEDIQLSAALSALEGLRLGVTTSFDHHASYGCISGSLDANAEGQEAAGQRGVFCFEVSDRAGTQARDAALRENVDFAAAARSLPFRLGSMLGLHASFTLSDDSLEKAQEIAHEQDLRIHIHAGEAVDDHVDGGIVKRLENFNLLQPGSLLAHGVHLSLQELQRLGELGVILVHNPSSNMNNGVGRLDLTAATRAGVQVVLGTDAYGFGLLGEARIATLMQRHAPRIGDGDLVQEVLLQSNPQLASLLLPGLGRLMPGAPADVVVTDYVPPTRLDSTNYWNHLLFGNVESHVHTVFVDGERVVDAGHSTRLDEDELFRGCTERAAELGERLLKLGSHK